MIPSSISCSFSYSRSFSWNSLSRPTKFPRISSSHKPWPRSFFFSWTTFCFRSGRESAIAIFYSSSSENAWINFSSISAGIISPIGVSICTSNLGLAYSTTGSSWSSSSLSSYGVSYTTTPLFQSSSLVFEILELPKLLNILLSFSAVFSISLSVMTWFGSIGGV